MDKFSITPMVIAIPGLLILVLIEVLVARWKGARVYRFQDTITSINIGLLSQFVNATGAVISVFMYNAIETRYGSFEWQTTSMLTWIFALLLYDFLCYWVHRTGPEYPGRAHIHSAYAHLITPSGIFPKEQTP